MVDDKDAKQRLSNIRTHEVSLVDEAANNEEFLIVKRKGGVGNLKLSKKDVDLFKTTISEIIDDDEVLDNMDDENLVEKRVVSTPDKVESAIEKLNNIKETFIKMDERGEDVVISEDIQKDIQDVTSLLSGKTGEIETEKAGKKISGSRIKKLKEMLVTLQLLIDETDSEGGDAKVEKTTINDVKDEETIDTEKDKKVEDNPETSEKTSDVTKNKDDGSNDSEILKAIGKLSETVEDISKRLETVESGTETPVRKGANEGETEEDEEVKKNKPKAGLFDDLIGMG